MAEKKQKKTPFKAYIQRRNSSSLYLLEAVVLKMDSIGITIRHSSGDNAIYTDIIPWWNVEYIRGKRKR